MLGTSEQWESRGELAEKKAIKWAKVKDVLNSIVLPPDLGAP